MAITASADVTARFWDLTTSACLHTLTGHTWSVNAVTTAHVPSRTAPFAITTSDDGTARVWDLTGGDCLLTLPGHGYGTFGTAHSTHWQAGSPYW